MIRYTRVGSQFLTLLLTLSCVDAMAESQQQVRDRERAYTLRYPDIDYDTLRQAVELKEVLVIDSNSEESYVKGHIPSALSLQNREELLAALPVIKSFPIVVYCGGPKCNAWHESADLVASRGYTNVMHFSEGIKGWTKQGGKLQSNGR